MFQVQFVSPRYVAAGTAISLPDRLKVAMMSLLAPCAARWSSEDTGDGMGMLKAPPENA